MVTLPPVKKEHRERLLERYSGVPTQQLEEMARRLPGGRKVVFQDRAVIIAFLLGTR